MEERSKNGWKGRKDIDKRGICVIHKFQFLFSQLPPPLITSLIFSPSGEKNELVIE